MLKRTIFLVLIGLLLGAGSVFAASGPLVVPVGGNFTDASGGTGSFTGQFALVEFASDTNQVIAKGLVSGILTDSHGKIVASIMRDVAIPVAATSGTQSSGRISINAVGNCPILHLDLGPLHLDVLGLRVDLSEVILDISAQSGPGNLLGNLLCAVANLLNGGGSAATLSNLLNQILQAIVNLLG